MQCSWARMGLSVLACDASKGMIEVAQRRKAFEGGDLPINFLTLPTELIRSVAGPGSFDGVFSNFSGLNFVRDLGQVAKDLAALTRPRARLLLCVASRICLSETLWFAAQFQMKRAARRFSGFSIEPVGDAQIEVWYRTVQNIRRQFSPFFRLYDVRAVGLSVPPYYFEPWAKGTLWECGWQQLSTASSSVFRCCERWEITCCLLSRSAREPSVWQSHSIAAGVRVASAIISRGVLWRIWSSCDCLPNTPCQGIGLRSCPA